MNVGLYVLLCLFVVGCVFAPELVCACTRYCSAHSHRPLPSQIQSDGRPRDGSSGDEGTVKSPRSAQLAKQLADVTRSFEEQNRTVAELKAEVNRLKSASPSPSPPRGSSPYAAHNSSAGVAPVLEADVLTTLVASQTQLLSELQKLKAEISPPRSGSASRKSRRSNARSTLDVPDESLERTASSVGSTNATNNNSGAGTKTPTRKAKGGDGEPELFLRGGG